MKIQKVLFIIFISQWVQSEQKNFISDEDLSQLQNKLNQILIDDVITEKMKELSKSIPKEKLRKLNMPIRDITHVSEEDFNEIQFQMDKTFEKYNINKRNLDQLKTQVEDVLNSE